MGDYQGKLTEFQTCEKKNIGFKNEFFIPHLRSEVHFNLTVFKWVHFNILREITVLNHRIHYV